MHNLTETNQATHLIFINEILYFHGITLLYNNKASKIANKSTKDLLNNSILDGVF